MKYVKCTIPLLALLLFFGTSAVSSSAEVPKATQDKTSGSATDVSADTKSESWPWRFHANIYGWLPKAPADISIDGHEVAHLPESLDNILDSLEVMFMGEFEVHKGPIGVFGSPIYYKGKYDEHFRGELGAKRKFTLEETLWLLKYGVSYDFGPWPLAPNRPQNNKFPTLILQPYVGGLYLHDDIESKVDPGPLDDGLDVDTTLKFNTPIIGFNTLWDLAEHWTARLGFNYGGWDIDDVDETYEFVGTVDYHFMMWNVSSKAIVGYRYLHIDYKKKGIEIDLDVKGPLVGIGWEF
jgi:hypothetical protein